MGDLRWYKRDPEAAILITAGLTLEERGGYFTLVEFIYLRRGNMPDDEKMIASLLRCDRRVWRRIRLKLIAEKLLILRNGFIFDCGRMVAPDRSPIGASIRRRVLERDGHVCRYCGDESGPFEIDHVFPVSRGGQNHLSNLAVACKPCNLSKRAKTLEEWQWPNCPSSH